MSQKIKFHLDESVSNAIANGLRKRGIDVTTSPSSGLIGALDLNWKNPDERNLALGMVLGVLSQVETHLESEPETKSHPVVGSSLETARQIKAQDVELDEMGELKLRKGVAKNRRITIEDEEMRHGWKGETAFIYL